MPGTEHFVDRKRVRYRVNRNKMLRAALIALCAVVILTGSIIMISGILKDKKETVETPDVSASPVSDIDEVKESSSLILSNISQGVSSYSIIETNENCKIYATYPKTLSIKIDKKLEKYVRRTVDHFAGDCDVEQEKRSEIKITYETFTANDSVISVLLTKRESRTPLYQELVDVKGFLFDARTDEEIPYDEFFTGEYRKYINNALFDKIGDELGGDLDELNEMDPSPEFILNNSGIDAVFDKRQFGIGEGTVRVTFTIPQIVTFIADAYKTGIYDVDPEPIEDYMPVMEGIDSSKKLVAFSFDDGPNGDTTKRIVAALKRYNAHATFFVVGNRTKTEKQRDAMNACIEAGCEIGNHTYAHTKLTALSESELRKAIEDCNDAVEEAVGKRTSLLRPPGGSTNQFVRDNAGYPLIKWAVDTRDWESRDKDQVLAHLKSETFDGAIVLMHDLYESTADAVEEILPWLYDQGYQVVSVSELMAARGVNMKKGEVYFSAKPDEVQ